MATQVCPTLQTHPHGTHYIQHPSLQHQPQVGKRSRPTDSLESVYNLIPAKIVPKVKAERYVSQFAGKAKEEYASGTRKMGTFGPVQVPRSSPNSYVKRNEGEKRREDAAVRNHSPHLREEPRKNPTPHRDDPGIIKHNKVQNYVSQNANEMKGAHPPAEPAPATVYVKKADYGKTPEYIHVRKEELDLAALHRVQEMEARQREQEAASGLILLPEAERVRVLSGLQSNLDALNHEYGKLSLTVDTLPKITRKLNIEAQMEKLEGAIAKFSHNKVYVKVH